MKKIIALTIASMLLSACCSICGPGLPEHPPEHKIVNKKAFKVIGMNTYTDFMNGNFDQFPATWMRFCPYMNEIKGRINTNNAYGISFYLPGWTPKSKWSYMAAVEVKNLNNIPITMLGKTIPANKYAVFTHKGLIKNLAETYYYIYTKWLPESKYEKVFGYDFELYDERFKRGESDDSEVDVYIPIKDKIATD